MQRIIVIILVSLISVSLSAKPKNSRLSELEKSNLIIVEQFINTLPSLDIEKISETLAENFSHTGMRKTIKGKDNFAKFWQMMISDVSRQNIVIKRHHAIGNTVLIERNDTVWGASDDDKMSLNLVSLFVLKEGKIIEWREHLLPVLKE